MADTTTDYTYDAAGNLTSRRPKGQSTPTVTYDWNALGQLTSVTDTTQTTTFAYDATGRRVRQQTPTDRSEYVFDGNNLLIEQVTKDLTIHRTTNVHAGNMLLGSSFPAAQQFFHPDGTGNIGEVTTWSWAEAVGVFAEANTQISRYSYAPYGQSNRVDAGSLTDPELDRHTYSGAWGVRDSVDNLYDMRNRFYDPSLGRFISRDPLEHLTGQPYQYANNNPISYVDPLGLCSVGPVRIGFLSNQDNSCRGAGVTRAVGQAVGSAASTIGDGVGTAASTAGGAIVTAGQWAWSNPGDTTAIIGGIACTAATAGTATGLCSWAAATAATVNVGEAAADSGIRPGGKPMDWGRFARQATWDVALNRITSLPGKWLKEAIGQGAIALSQAGRWVSGALAEGLGLGCTLMCPSPLDGSK